MKNRHGAMVLLVLFLVASAATAEGTSSSSSTCSMRKEEIEDCRGKIFKSFQDQSQSTLTLEDPHEVQCCCDQILAEQCCVRPVCPVSLPDEVCPAIVGNVCAGHNGSVSNRAGSPSPLQQSPRALLIELLCFAVVNHIFGA